MDRDIFKLKQQHLEALDEKRKQASDEVSKLYLEFSETVDFSASGRGLIFSKFYHYYAERFRPEINDGELLVGTGLHWCWSWNERHRDQITPKNTGHFIADFEHFLKLGISGIGEELKKGESADREAMELALSGFSKYIKRYAETAMLLSEQETDGSAKKQLEELASDLRHLSENPPETFRQALQLVLFLQIFLHTESNSAAISLGRADRYLYPYYKADIEQKRITKEDALYLIMCFYIKLSEEDDSQMLTVSGDDENELSELLIRAQTTVDMRQPSIGLIVSEHTSRALMEEAKKLVLKGGGMPAFFNAEVIRKGLLNIGIREDHVDDFGIVGCYEAAPAGSFSNTTAYGFHLYDSFDEFLHSEQKSDSFDEFLEHYKHYFRAYYQNNLIPKFRDKLHFIKSQESPFAALLLKGCIQRGLFPERFGCDYFLFGINILGIGLVIDSIYTVKKLVFEQKRLTIRELADSATCDFAVGDALHSIKSLKSHFGSDDAETNALAKELSDFIFECVVTTPLEKNVIVSPGLFWFLADVHQRDYRSTVNGRIRGELLSYGVMPCATPHKTDLSSALLSTASVSCEKFPNGCPVMIPFSEQEIKKPGFLEAIIKSYFQKGGFQLAINVVEKEMLKKAQADPTGYENIIVKISGYSAHFTKLDQNTQDAVIQRLD